MNTHVFNQHHLKMGFVHNPVQLGLPLETAHVFEIERGNNVVFAARAETEDILSHACIVNGTKDVVKGVIGESEQQDRPSLVFEENAEKFHTSEGLTVSDCPRVATLTLPVPGGPWINESSRVSESITASLWLQVSVKSVQQLRPTLGQAFRAHA